MLLLEELEVLSTTPIQPVVFRDEMFHLDKKFVMDILISRGMFENGAKVRDHPGFSRTPVVRNGLSCNQCDKKFKKTTTFNNHKCV